MNQYLTAIGFGDIESKKELYEILTQVEQKFTQHELTLQDGEMDFCEFRKEYSEGIGISLFGDMDMNSHFQKQYYFPYFNYKSKTIN